MKQLNIRVNLNNIIFSRIVSFPLKHYITTTMDKINTELKKFIIRKMPYYMIAIKIYN